MVLSDIIISAFLSAIQSEPIIILCDSGESTIINLTLSENLPKCILIRYWPATSIDVLFAATRLIVAGCTVACG